MAESRGETWFLHGNWFVCDHRQEDPADRYHLVNRDDIHVILNHIMAYFTTTGDEIVCSFSRRSDTVSDTTWGIRVSKRTVGNTGPDMRYMRVLTLCLSGLCHPSMEIETIELLLTHRKPKILLHGLVIWDTPLDDVMTLLDLRTISKHNKKRYTSPSTDPGQQDNDWAQMQYEQVQNLTICGDVLREPFLEEGVSDSTTGTFEHI